MLVKYQFLKKNLVVKKAHSNTVLDIMMVMMVMMMMMMMMMAEHFV